MTEENKKEDDTLGSFYVGRMRPPPEPERKLPRGVLTGVVLVAFVGILWYAYPRGQEQYTDIDVPVVKADATPYKSAPEEPGGMEVRHQDSTVFETLDGGAGKTDEKVVAAQEKPMDKEQLGLDEGTKLNLAPQVKENVPPVAAEAAPVPVPAPVPETITPETPAVAEAKPAEVIKPEEKPAPPPAEEKKASGNTWIQLGSYRDVAGAKKEWESVRKKNASLVKGAGMRTEKVALGAKGIFYRLQVGPFGKDEAAAACAGLKKAGSGCFVVK
jgi:cell division protein FtsN